MFIPAFTTNAMTSDFLSLISSFWVVMFLASHRTVFTFLSLLDLMGVVLAFLISIPKMFKLLQKYWHRGYRYHKLRKTFGKFLRSELLSKFGIYIVSEICFWRNLSSGILRWSCLQTKEGQMRSKFCLAGLDNSQTPSTRKSMTQWSSRGWYMKVLCLALLHSCTDLS